MFGNHSNSVIQLTLRPFQIRFLQLGSELKKSVTCVQLASIDFELIQLRHNERWRRFLADHVPSEKLLTLAKVPS